MKRKREKNQRNVESHSPIFSRDRSNFNQASETKNSALNKECKYTKRSARHITKLGSFLILRFYYDIRVHPSHVTDITSFAKISARVKRYFETTYTEKHGLGLSN